VNPWAPIFPGLPFLKPLTLPTLWYICTGQSVPYHTTHFLLMDEKKINYRTIVLILMAVSAVAVLFVLNQKKSSLKSFTPETLRIGRPAPDFSFPGLDGKIVSLSDYRGKVVLVNIWATWCAPCVNEVASMEKLYQEFKGDDFEILAVSVDAPGLKAVAPFMKAHKLSFPALIDSEGTIKNLYKATGVPESFIVNRQGILVEKIIGPLDWSAPEVLRFFRKLIGKPLPRRNN